MRKVKLIVAVALGLGLSLPVSVSAARGNVSTYTGRIYAGDGQTALSAQLDRPEGIWATPQRDGRIFVADTLNNVIRLIRPPDALGDRAVSTLAGTGDIGRRDGPATSATFGGPTDVTLVGATLYILDSGNGRLRAYSFATRTVRTVLTGLKTPQGILYDSRTGVLYVSDTGNNRVLKVSRAGRILRRYRIASPTKLTKVGSQLYLVNNGRTTVTALALASGRGRIVVGGLVDASGIDQAGGTVYFSAGSNGIYNEYWRYNPATRSAVQLQNRLETEWYNYLSDLQIRDTVAYAAFSRGSSIFTMDLNGENPVRLAGEHRYGDRDGGPTEALLGRPKYLLKSPDGGTLFILENHKIKALDVATQQLRLLAGHANDNYVEDTGGTEGRLSGGNQMALSPDGKTIYVADRNNNRIRTLDIATATFHYLTGAGAKNADARTRNGYQNGRPCPNEFNPKVSGCAYFSRPNGIAVSPDGATVYVADTDNHRIRKVDVATGKVTLLAGGGARGLKDGVGGRAWFKSPWTLQLSGNGKTLYVVDIGNHAIRAVDIATRSVTTIVGNGQPGYRNGSLSQARLSFPEYLALGPGADTLYVSEAGTNRIRVLILGSTIDRLSGNGRRGSRNGGPSLSTFNGPKGMLVLGDKLLVADQLNDLIRAIQL
jgi:sugar lactone lactonase YvrE